MRFHGLTPLEHLSLKGSRLVACASLIHQGVSATLYPVYWRIVVPSTPCVCLRIPIHLSHFESGPPSIKFSDGCVLTLKDAPDTYASQTSLVIIINIHV